MLAKVYFGKQSVVDRHKAFSKKHLNCRNLFGYVLKNRSLRGIAEFPRSSSKVFCELKKI